MQEEAKMVTWVIDPVHSTIRFDTKYLLITSVSGWFREFDGTVQAVGEGFSDCGINLTIYANSIYTGIEERDSHLRSADFFDTQNFPVISFRSTQVHQSGDGFRICGLLCIKDHTEQLEFSARYVGSAQDPHGNTKAGFELDTVFNRKDFNMGWNQFFDRQGILLSDQVRIHCDVQLLRLPG